MLKFHFNLQPVDETAPCGKEGDLYLDWFGLTDGYFWIEVDGHELLRYSDAIRQKWAEEYPEEQSVLYLDYQVVRIWEELKEMLALVLQPVPEDIANLVAPDGPWGTEQRWNEWTEKTQAALEAWEGDPWDLYQQAVFWWSYRQLHFFFSKAGFGLRFWRVGDMIHIRWDNVDRLQDGIPVWQEISGEATLPVTEFVDAVKSFDHEFMAAMAERIEQIKAHWARPEIRIDPYDLEWEHQRIVTSMENALGRPAWGAEWDEVRAALAKIDASVTFPE